MAEDCLESGDHVDARGIFGYANFYLKKNPFYKLFCFYSRYNGLISNFCNDELGRILF